jgi:hypothetical protein
MAQEPATSHSDSDSDSDINNELRGNETTNFRNQIEAGGQSREKLAQQARGNLAAELALKAYQGKRILTSSTPPVHSEPLVQEKPPTVSHSAQLGLVR